MDELASKLSDRFGGAQAFFCNSGAESIEAALKWARKVTGREQFVALEGSFHGRTMGALSVTGQPAKRTAFAPLVPGAVFATPETLAEHVGPDTAAILLEPVQGEGGVIPLAPEVLAQARALADEHGALLIFDEVQTGVGRCGSFFAWERLCTKPDALTLAKGLANGLPIGALLVADEKAGAFVPGDHASTFGGNPVSCAAACAVVDELTDELLAEVRAKEQLARDVFPALRGRGLLLALDVDRPAGDVAGAAFDRGVLLCTAGPETIRITPPLTITTGELAHGLAVLQEVLA
jgi:acetylornithine/succinyldiaminopimelate/putrescine aminotransferase